MAGGRPKMGTHRMDAAIDRFTRMGYAKAHVRTVVNKLLSQVYGIEGWPFLEEDCYHVVQDALFEEEELRQLQLQAEEEDVEEAAQLEATTDEALVENMSILEVHHEEPVLPLPAAARTVGTRPPCYGWISESDSDSELDSDPIQHVVKIRSAGEGLPDTKIC